MSGRYMSSDLTPDFVRALLKYDAQTGIVTRVGSGQIAGFRHKDGYWRIKIKERSYLRHRLIWFMVMGEWPTADIDHRNMIRGDDRWSNLRACTPSENRANTRAQSNNSHGMKGVTWHNQQEKWMAQITVKGVHTTLGLYPTPEAAHEAYCAAASKHFGEYARAA